MIYSMEAKVGISKVEIQIKIGCSGEFWQKWVIYVVIKFETSTSSIFLNFFHIFYKTYTKLIYLKEVAFSFVHKIYWKCKNTLNFNTVLLDFRFLCHNLLTSKIHNLVQEWAMKLGFGPKYFLKCVLTDSVNNSILKKIDFGLNGPDCVTYVHALILQCVYHINPAIHQHEKSLTTVVVIMTLLFLFSAHVIWNKTLSKSHWLFS